ncbi:MAG: hypothetical protein RRY23_08195 [Alistipes sp.]
MKKLLHVSLMTLTVSLLLGAYSCTKENNEEVLPKINLEIGAVTSNSITFTATPTQATKCAYVCVPAGESTPTTEEIIGGVGISIPADKASTKTLSELIDGTKYTIIAVVQNERGQNASISKEVTTEALVFDRFLTFIRATKNSFSFHIKPQGTSGYSYLIIQSSELEGKPESLFPTLLSFYGTTATEEQTVTVTDMDTDADDNLIEVIPGMEYTVLAAELDANGEIVGELSKEAFSTKTPAVSTATVTVSEVEITTTSIEYLSTPDQNIASYFQVWTTAVKYNKLMEKGEEAVRTLIFEEGKRYFKTEKIKKDRLTAGKEYVVATIAFDKAYDQANMLITKIATANPSTAAPTIDFKAYVSDKYGAEFGAYSYNSICCDIKTTNTTTFKDCVMETSKVTALLAGGATLETIVKEHGLDWTMPEDLADLNSAEGYIGYWKSGIKSNTAYTIIVYAQNSYGTSTIASATATTTAKSGVNSELFTLLLGDWTATMTVKNASAQSESISFPVTIAKGVNESTEIAYKNDNRLVCLGYAGKEYRSPQNLIDEVAYYKSHPSEAYVDYGPKWFLEIADGDVVTVPSSDKVAPLYGYYEYPSYIAGYNGSDVSAQRAFAVEVSADKTQLTIKAYTVSESLFYPSILNKKSNGWGLITQVLSDVVLVKKSTAASSKEVRRLK